MDLELTGKRAIVTGGSRGIGLAVARALLAEGARVGIAARDPIHLREASELLAAEGELPVVRLEVDTGSDASVHAMVQEATGELGGIDILVNGAARVSGRRPAPSVARITPGEFFEDVNVKVMGYLRCIQEVLPLMQAQGSGRIVNISGLSARSVGNAIGTMRNVAVAALSKSLADQLAGTGISVVTVHPGTTRTETTPPELLGRGAGNLLGRIVDAEEVASVIAFLCSPRGVAINGDCVSAGGGVPGPIYY